MKRYTAALISLFSLAIIAMFEGTAPAIALNNSCVQFLGRDDGGDTGYLVHNSCGMWVTVNVYFSDGGSDYLIIAPGNRNWTINVFDSYKVCASGPKSPKTDC